MSQLAILRNGLMPMTWTRWRTASFYSATREIYFRCQSNERDYESALATAGNAELLLRKRYSEFNNADELLCLRHAML